MSASDWVIQRLPDGADFSKNGVTQSIDEAVTDALADYTTESAFAQKRYALADLLEILDSNVEFDNEKLGDWQGTGPRYVERIKALREEAAAQNTTDSGTFSNTGAAFTPSVSDEFTQTN